MLKLNKNKIKIKYREISCIQKNMNSTDHALDVEEQNIWTNVNLDDLG